MTLRVLVADDGHGLPTPVVRGVGLPSMAHRAAAAGGTFDVASTDSGTVVRAWFPALHVDEIRVAPANVTVASRHSASSSPTTTRCSGKASPPCSRRRPT